MNEKTKPGEENGREDIRWEAKEHGGCYREESEDEKERWKVEVFLIYHLCTVLVHKDSHFPISAMLELGLRHPPPK